MPLNFVAKAAIQVGLMAANMALTMSRKIEGPRLDDLKFTSGDYGSTLPMVWGMRRVQAPIFWAEDLREVKRESKTKGGKFNSYTYYGSWAVALAGHEIDSVRRIWFDTHLVFDLSGAGPVTPFDFGTPLSGESAVIGSGSKQSPYFAIYTGTETQTADPRIEATIEALHGEGSCPAYRDTAYVVFKDVPLEKLGNRIPQVSVEFVANTASTTVPYATTAQPQITTFNSAIFSTDYSRALFTAYSGANTPFEIWDVAARTPIVWGTLSFGSVSGGSIGMYADGTFLLIAGTGPDQKLYTVASDGSSSAVLMSFDGVFHGQNGVRVLRDGAGTEHWISYGDSGRFYLDGATLDYGLSCKYAFVDAYGDIWALLKSGSVVTFQRVVDCGAGPGWPDSIAVTLSGAVGTVYAVHARTADGDRFILGPNSEGGGYYNYVIDPAAASVVTRVSVGTAGVAIVPQAVWDNIVPGSSSYWVRDNEISLVTGAVLRSAFTPDTSPATNAHTFYDPINHAVIEDVTGGLKWWFLDRIANAGVPISTIAADLAAMVEADDVDFSDLDQTVPGYSATQGQASAILEPLLDAWDSDLRPHEFTLQGLKRTGTSGGTLLTERFVAGTPRYAVKVRQSAELARALTINFADTTADQQPNNTRAARPLDATGARGEKSIDLSTVALDPDAALALGDRYFRRLWNERKEVSLGLTAQQLALEPGDVRTLDLDGEVVPARLIKLTVKADDSLATEWVYDHPSLAVLGSDTGAPFDGRNPSVVVVPLLSKGFVLDIPLLRDVDNSANPLLYLAASPYASGAWAGATIFELVGSEYTGELAAISSSSPAAWGYANAALADANPNLWDRLNTVNVTLQTGTLTGCSEADIDTTPARNLALIGGEIVNFTTATLEGDGSYTLSGFKRGRRGTEWATATHAARDVFLLLDTAARQEMGLSDVGTSLSFKAITSGRTESGAFPIPVSFTGASLKPYAACHLAGVKDSGSGDWALSWVRRTRIGGAWTSSTSIPLGETSEEYEVEIMNGGTVVRTVTGLTTPAFTWTAAMQTTDFGSGQSTVSFRVYQISDAVGRGFRASATL